MNFLFFDIFWILYLLVVAVCQLNSSTAGRRLHTLRLNVCSLLSSLRWSVHIIFQSVWHFIQTAKWANRILLQGMNVKSLSHMHANGQYTCSSLVPVLFGSFIYSESGGRWRPEAACMLSTAQPLRRKRLEMLSDKKLCVEAAPALHVLIVQIRALNEGSDMGTFVYEKWSGRQTASWVHYLSSLPWACENGCVRAQR